MKAIQERQSSSLVQCSTQNGGPTSQCSTKKNSSTSTLLNIIPSGYYFEITLPMFTHVLVLLLVKDMPVLVVTVLTVLLRCEAPKGASSEEKISAYAHSSPRQETLPGCAPPKRVSYLRSSFHTSAHLLQMLSICSCNLTIIHNLTVMQYQMCAIQI